MPVLQRLVSRALAFPNGVEMRKRLALLEQDLAGFELHLAVAEIFHERHLLVRQRQEERRAAQGTGLAGVHETENSDGRAGKKYAFAAPPRNRNRSRALDLKRQGRDEIA
jgi:hypothetical protein